MIDTLNEYGGKEYPVLEKGKSYKLTVKMDGVVDVKYNENYLLISVDTTYSMNPENIDKKTLKYFIHNLKRDTIIKKISYFDLRKIIKEKSLEDIDLTK